ncbi:hypothetical protein [Photorhabdus viridis]|uniref:hypothetical protein n=1 Tax=Photorhabdus viridis TaxID=3163327 RepID=UPI0033077DAD
MNKELKLESNKCFSHLMTIFYDLRMRTVMNERPDEIEALCNDEDFMGMVFKECIKKAKSHLPLVERRHPGAEGVSVKLVDLAYVMERLKAYHQDKGFMKESQK